MYSLIPSLPGTSLRLVTMPTAVAGVGFQWCWVLSVFPLISQKPMQRGSPNLTKKCSTMSPRNPFILGSRGHEAQEKSVLVCRRNAVLTLAAHVSYVGLFPAAVPLPQKRHQIFPASLRSRYCCRPPVFSCMEFFAVSRQQNHCWCGS